MLDFCPVDFDKAVVICLGDVLQNNIYHNRMTFDYTLRAAGDWCASGGPWFHEGKASLAMDGDHFLPSCRAWSSDMARSAWCTGTKR